jgi:hypothetical protein
MKRVAIHHFKRAAQNGADRSDPKQANPERHAIGQITVYRTRQA